jgi:hypothetical protein
MPEVDPFGAERSVATASDASQALVILARELYWAGDPISRTPTDAGSVRERLHTFSHRLRVEAREMYPSSETSLDRSPRLRRRVKRRLWFGIRFATLRYDRLLAELAELNAQLADRVATLERELERRGDRDDARDEP